MVTFLSELSDLELWATDVGSARLEARAAELTRHLGSIPTTTARLQPLLDELMQVLDEANDEYLSRVARTTRNRDVRRFISDVSIHLKSQPASDAIAHLQKQASRLLDSEEPSVP